MKSLKIITTLLSVAVCTAGVFGSGAAASAESNVTFYPENFTEYVDGNVTEITDFAVGKNSYAVADGNKIIVIESGTPSFYNANSAVTALDCVYDEENGYTFFFKDGDDKTYSLPEMKPAEHVFAAISTIYTTEDGEYKLLDSAVHFCPADGTVYQQITENDATFTLIKLFEGVLYGVCGNQLFKFDKTDSEKLTLDFTDYSSASSIPIGNTIEKLKGFNTEKLYFVTLNDGAYLTEIDLNMVAQTYFKVDKTYKIGVNEGFTAGKSAILLGTTGTDGEVSLVAFGGKAYIMRTENTSAIEKNAVATTEFDTATVSIASASAYSSPLVSVGTKLFALEPGAKVKVLGKVTMATAQELHRDFYLIEYMKDETSQKGFVPFGYISEFKYNENGPNETQDPEATYENTVKTVVLILLVVLLVLIAIGYLTWIATSKKNNPDKTDETK